MSKCSHFLFTQYLQVELAFRKFDLDKDGFLSWEEFSQVLESTSSAFYMKLYLFLNWKASEICYSLGKTWSLNKPFAFSTLASRWVSETVPLQLVKFTSCQNVSSGTSLVHTSHVSFFFTKGIFGSFFLHTKVQYECIC